MDEESDARSGYSEVDGEEGSGCLRRLGLGQV